MEPPEKARPEHSDNPTRVTDFSIPEDIPPVHIGISLMYVLILIAGVTWCWVTSRDLVRSFALVDMLVQLPLAILAGGLTVGGFGLIWKHTQYFRNLEVEFAKRLGNLNVEGVIRLALLSSVAEEVFFRGAMQPAMGEWFGNDTLGYVTTCLVFGMLHTAPSRGFVGYIGFATLAGFFLGGSYLLTGNILVPIIIHFTINAVNMWLIVTRARRRSEIEAVHGADVDVQSPGTL